MVVARALGLNSVPATMPAAIAGPVPAPAPDEPRDERRDDQRERSARHERGGGASGTSGSTGTIAGRGNNRAKWTTRARRRLRHRVQRRKWEGVPPPPPAPEAFPRVGLQREPIGRAWRSAPPPHSVVREDNGGSAFAHCFGLGLFGEVVDVDDGRLVRLCDSRGYAGCGLVTRDEWLRRYTETVDMRRPGFGPVATPPGSRSAEGSGGHAGETCG